MSDDSVELTEKGYRMLIAARDERIAALEKYRHGWRELAQSWEASSKRWEASSKRWEELYHDLRQIVETHLKRTTEVFQ